MLLLKLSATQIGMFDEAPEAGMGVHFARVEDGLGIVLSGRVLMLPYAEEGEGKSQSDALSNRLWFGAETRGRRPETLAPTSEAEIAEENTLIEALANAPLSTRYASATDPFVMGFILHPAGYLPPPPRRPTYTYGHLPFSGTTQAGDVFYRCEHWATSQRVRYATNDILARTYGFPASELRFVPTGFAAVGRYALPDLPPACRRYEIRPPPGYTLQCGACVPLYGQAGGGVEVMFPKTFTNAVQLPPPTSLPPL
jgi:hypothetical protein